MKQPKHTPGPWVAEIIENHSNEIWAGRINVASIREQGVNSGHPNEYEPNARLIAAAPELLEALEYLVYRLTEHSACSEGDVQKAQLAIAKARGEL